jgi:hypothetical protein
VKETEGDVLTIPVRRSKRQIYRGTVLRWWSRIDAGSAEGGCLLIAIIIFLIASVIFMFTGDGFCFEYC